MKRKYADGGGVDTEMEPGSGSYEGEMPEPGRSEPRSFKEAFAKARGDKQKVFSWQGKDYTTELAKNKPAPAVPGRPRGESVGDSTSNAEIPKGGSAEAPAATGEDTSGPSNLDRALLGIPAAGGALAGAAKLRQMQNAKRAAETAKAAAARFSQPQAREVTKETGRRFTGKQELEAAESTMRGATNRKALQAKREESARGQAEVMERNKPVMQATPKKASPRGRTRDEDVDYELRARGGRVGYAKGGSVKGWGMARGAKACKNY